MSVFEYNGSYSRRYSRYFHGKRARADSNVWYRVESLTEEKRMSYFLHKNEIQPWRFGTGLLFEHFVVVGVPRSHIEENRSSLTIHNRAFDPKILFNYPATECPYASEVPHFCFPEGVNVKLVERTPSASSLLEHLFRSSRELRQTNSHMFILNTPEGYIYGICLKALDLIDNDATFGDSDDAATRTSVSLQKHAIFSPTCYCFLTRNPFLDFFYDILEGIVALEHLRAIRGNVCSEIIEHVSAHSPLPLSRKTLDPPRKRSLAKRLSAPVLGMSIENGLVAEDLLDEARSNHDQQSDADSCSTISEKDLLRGHDELDGEDDRAVTSPSHKLKAEYMKELINIFHTLQKLPPVPKPPMKHIEFHAEDSVISSIFALPESPDVESSLLLRWAFPIVLSKISPKTLVKLLTNILLERPVVVLSLDLRLLGAIG
eukprot:TRINITY_DN3060_c0_g2_i3.p1 TRINITY_DN3060_c0_g2~~TRINITY_DN3060_c0_g2_i3.p1  ORF type:complete len:431 (-),score=77.20 TRINITY_DN3060_c0_g2_i3:35-1327(-)